MPDFPQSNQSFWPFLEVFESLNVYKCRILTSDISDERVRQVYNQSTSSACGRRYSKSKLVVMLAWGTKMAKKKVLFSLTCLRDPSWVGSVSALSIRLPKRLLCTATASVRWRIPLSPRYDGLIIAVFNLVHIDFNTRLGSVIGYIHSGVDKNEYQVKISVF